MPTATTATASSCWPSRGLRELGFRDDEVFRAIVYRPSDGQHHMVTFWFEDRTIPG